MNLLPLETFRELMGLHPWHFWGLANSATVPVTSACPDLLAEYPWQRVDLAARDELREAIVTAEARFRQWAGYRPAPGYTSELVAWPSYHDGRALRTGPYGADGRWLTVQLPEGEIRAVGVEALTLIGTVTVAGGSLVFSDADGDGLDETFVATIATTVTDTAQIALYFAAADRLDAAAAGERWRIRPVSVSISGGVATIRGRRWLLVKPLKYEGVAVSDSGLDPTTAANIAASLEVYQRTTSSGGTTTATSQAVIIWETRPSHGWWCCCGCTDAGTAFAGAPYDPAATAEAVARVGIRNARLGLVAPAEATYNTTDAVWSSLNWSVCDQPDRVLVRYLAGVPLESDGQMRRELRTVIARLAAAELARPVTACQKANREIDRWQFDLARTSGANDEAYGAISAADLDNPLGTRRGQVSAWKYIRHARLFGGIIA